MSRNDKNKKYAPLNINNVFKGKVVEPQTKPSYKLSGMQNIGKVSSMRRVPPPKWVPSLKAETGVSDGRQMGGQAAGSGWVNAGASQDSGDGGGGGAGTGVGAVRSQAGAGKAAIDKSQWNSKISANKPFFLMGQEFPSLQSDSGSHDAQESNLSKDSSKIKELESSKSKIEDLRNRDANISVSTLNRIDALSISKSSKGDIAATGWAAEDEEPNFDEKIVFSDEESSNEIQNWHSDNEDASKSERCEKRDPVDIPPIISDVWHDQPSQSIRYQQYSPLQIPVNVPGSFINAQFQQNMMNRNPPCTITNIGEEPGVYMGSSTVAEQRNARNLEYICAIERARQKKFATQSSRGSCGLIDDHNPMDAALMRSRNTSMTSDTTESMSQYTPVEMGPPGGPPLMHQYHKPHLQPQLVNAPVQAPMMHPHNISVISPTIPPSSMIRYNIQQHAPYNLMPMAIDQTDSKLMEKFIEFLHLQSNMEIKPDNSNASVSAATVLACAAAASVSPVASSIPAAMDKIQVPPMMSTGSQEIDLKSVSDSCPLDTERPQSHISSNNFPPNAGQYSEKENQISIEKAPGTAVSNKDNLTDRDSQKKTIKPKYYEPEENSKYDQSKKPSSKSKPYKEYRSSNKSSNYKGDYPPGSSATDRDINYYCPENNDDSAYQEDYHIYKQHYSRDYKGSTRSSYNRGNSKYSYYSMDPYYSASSRDTFAPDDYHLKSNSLKLKSSKSKDMKLTGSITEHSQSERESSSNKKFTSDNPDTWPHDNDITDNISDKKNKDLKKVGKVSKTAYQSKKYENRSYKDKSNEATQEISMGFEVNPKDNRKNYSSSNYNRRQYPDYSKYYSSNSKYGEDDYYYQDNYYPSDYYYEKDMNYSSTKFQNKRNNKNASSESWRSNNKDDKYNPRNTATETSSASGGQSKVNNRTNNNRKSDKRQFSTAKDSSNDIDQEEWETASEGGSVRSNSAPRDVHKLHNRQSNSQINTNDSNNKVIQNSGDSRKVNVNKPGSSYSCNGGNNSFNDNNGNQDGTGGASGSSGGTRILSSSTRSNGSQNRSVDSSQNKSMDKNSNNDSRNSDSTSKSCSNNNNSNKDNSSSNSDSVITESPNRNLSETVNSCASLNIDKYADYLESEELFYDNPEFQFQEVLSKATKKNRKLEEQRRLKEEYKLEQKRQEAQKFKVKQENNQAKKPVSKRDQNHRSNKIDVNSNHNKYEVKSASNNIRDKEVIPNSSFKKWENNKVAMQIGSWDNSLADEINSEMKAPPKPIGTPASTAWVKKSKNTFENNTTNNICQNSLSNDSIILTADMEPIPQPFIVSSDNSDVNFNTTMSYSYNNSIYNQTVRSNEEKKIDSSLETQASEIAIHDTINFDYDVKNINCDKNRRNILSNDRNVQINDQKLLNDKINSVKTIWDNQPATNNISVESKVTTSSSINPDIDIHTVAVSINQDVSNQRNLDNNLVNSSAPNPNVCKVKPQLQQDFRKDHNEIIINSQAIPFRNSPAAFLSQSHQGSFMPYHRFSEFLSDPMHASDAFASLLSNNQSGMHINYNLPNTHLIDSSLLRQNTQESILTNKVNFLNQTPSSYYPQPATTPKLMSNTPAQLPINMDMGSAHAPPHPMQQLLLTRQNSLTSMMQPPNPMTIPFIQSGQQPIQAQTPLFPTTPLLGPTNFSSQLNHFSQGHLSHYPHGNFPSLHPHTPQFQPNQQMLLNQHPHHHQQQQIIQSSLSHDRVLNSGQSGVFNSVMGPSDISTNAGLQDFSGQPKPLNPNNIMHGMSGSAFVLPHNLNFLMKSSMFGTNSQYNNFTTPIQSNLLGLKNGFDHNSNLKSIELDHFKHENSINDRNLYCADSSALQKPNEDYYQDLTEYDNCDMNYENWVRYPKVDIYTTNNLMSTFDFHSQKSPMQFSPMEPGSESAYRNYIAPFRDNHTSLATGLQTSSSLQYIISPRLKPNFNQDQSLMISRQHSKCYENPSFISINGYTNKNDSTDNNNKLSIKNTVCNALSTPNEVKETLTKDMSNLEKTLSENKKNSKQRTSYSDNFDEKNQSWSLIEDDRSVPPEDNRSSLKSSNTETSSHSPNKHFNPRSSNTYENQCQYGYDETQLSSQTAESLRKFDQDQLKKVIMKLREGPVMTEKNGNEFDFISCKGAPIPRLIPLQPVRNKQTNSKSFNNYNTFSFENYGNENISLGFYSRNRALTPPAAQYRSNRNKPNRNQNHSLSNNSNNSHSTNTSSNSNTNNNSSSNNTSANSSNSSNGNSVSNSNQGNQGSSNNSGRGAPRQKCDTKCDTPVDSTVVVDTSDLKLNNVQSKSLECDNLVLENIIDNPIL